MRWSVVATIWFREVRDQLRDRRTVFMLVILPILLYPALGIGMVQFAVLFTEQPVKVGVAGLELLELPVSQEKRPRGGAFSLDQLPRLVEGKHFAPELFKRNPANRVLIEVVRGDEKTLLEKLERDEIQAAVVIDQDFVRALKSGRQVPLDLRIKGVETDGDRGPRSSGKAGERLARLKPKDDRGELVLTRVRSVFNEWSQEITQARLKSLNIPLGFDEPLQVPELEPTARAERAWTRVFPFLIVMMAMTGALYPAIDLCAGEKERGTMETLLISPVSRSEIVWGKFLTVWLFSAVTALMNLISMGATAWHFSSFAGALLRGAEGPLPVPGLAALGWCVVLLIPLAAFLSATCLALAVYARSTKEGQYYLMPLMVVVLPLTLLSTAPGVELTAVYSMLPITGPALLLQALMNARSADQVPWVYLGPVLLPLAAYCYLALRWAVIQFNREDVLFREAVRLDFGLWLRHLLRDKDPLPTAAEAMTCFVIILGVTWFAFTGGTPANFLKMAAIQQLAVVAAPALFMALMLTTRPLETLRFQRPSIAFLFLAPLLALSFHAPLVWLLKVMLEKFSHLLPDIRIDAPLPSQILILGLLPAICEEIAFRGFILSGLSRNLSRNKAVLATSLLFALAHLNAFRFLHTFILGMVLGILAIRSGSLLPGILFHFVHNSVLVYLGHLGQQAKAEGLELPAWLREDILYSDPTVLISVIAAAHLLFLVFQLPMKKPPNGSAGEEAP